MAGLCGLRALALILSFTTVQNLFFREITSLKHVAIFGDETISIAQGMLNPCAGGVNDVINRTHILNPGAGTYIYPHR